MNYECVVLYKFVKYIYFHKKVNTLSEGLAWLLQCQCISLNLASYTVDEPTRKSPSDDGSCGIKTTQCPRHWEIGKRLGMYTKTPFPGQENRELYPILEVMKNIYIFVKRHFMSDWKKKKKNIKRIILLMMRVSLNASSS